MSRGIFITGTGTDVGKTYVTGLIVKKLHEMGKRAAYYKAAMSGNVREDDGKLLPGDALQVKRTAGIGQAVAEMCPYVYEAAVSPHLASRLEGEPVRLDVVKQGFAALLGSYDYITVEGSGGIACPLRFDTEKILLGEMIRTLGLPCLIVADAGLGTINAVVLTAEYMERRGIPVKGIILNRFHAGNIMEEDNKRMCEYLTEIPVLGCIEEGCRELPVEQDTLLGLYEEIGEGIDDDLVSV